MPLEQNTSNVRQQTKEVTPTLGTDFVGQIEVSTSQVYHQLTLQKTFSFTYKALHNSFRMFRPENLHSNLNFEPVFPFSYVSQRNESLSVYFNIEHDSFFFRDNTRRRERLHNKYMLSLMTILWSMLFLAF